MVVPPRLIVTGFGPFPRMPSNPSAALAQAVAASPRLRLHDVAARAVVLTTAYATLPGELDPLLAEQADAVLMIGVAGRSIKVRVETRATSRRSTLFPDAMGGVPRGLSTRKAAGDSRLARVNVLAALRRLRGRGLPARPSRDAGRYLCNAAYFRALTARSGPTLFIHIPRTPIARRAGRPVSRTHPVGVRWRMALARALSDVALDLVASSRRVAAAGPFR